MICRYILFTERGVNTGRLSALGSLFENLIILMTEKRFKLKITLSRLNWKDTVNFKHAILFKNSLAIYSSPTFAIQQQ